MEQQRHPRRADLEFLAEVAMMTGRPMSAILRAAVEAWVATPDGRSWAHRDHLYQLRYDRDPNMTGFDRPCVPSDAP